MLLPSSRKIIVFGLVIASTRSIVAAISIAYLVSKNLSVIDIAFIKSWQAVVILVFDIPFAYLADRKNKKITILVATFFCGCWMFLMAIASSKYVFYLAEFSNAIFMALLNGAYIAYLINSTEKQTEEEIKKVLSFYQQWNFLCIGVFGFLGAFFINIDDRWIWFFCGTLIFIEVLFFIFYLPKDIKSNYLLPVSFSWKTISNRTIEMIITSPSLISLLCLHSIIYQIIIQFWQPALAKEFFVTSGYFYSFVFLSVLLSQSLASYTCRKRVDILSIFIIVASISLILIYLSYYVNTLRVYIFITLLCLVFYINSYLGILISSKFHSRIDNQYRSTYDSIISTIIRCILLIVLPLVGYLIHYFNYQIIFSIFLCVLFGLLVYYRTSIKA